MLCHSSDVLYAVLYQVYLWRGATLICLFTVGTRTPMQTTLLFIVTLAVSAFGQQCFVGNPQPTPLTFCTEYASSSCCTVPNENQVAASMMAFARIYGNGTTCWTHVRNMSCAIACSPYQLLFARIVLKGNYNEIDAYASVAYAGSWFSSCANVLLPPRNVTMYNDTTNSTYTTSVQVPVSYAFNTSVDFVASFDTSNDPNYVPSLVQPAIAYIVGSHPTTGQSWNSTFPLPPPANTVANTNTAGNSGTPPPQTSSRRLLPNNSALFAPSMLGFIAIFLSLFKWSYRK